MYWGRGCFIALVLSGAALSAPAEDITHGAIPSPLMDLADRVRDAQPPNDHARIGHYAGVIEYPYDALLVRIHMIRAARRSIDLQTYIWANDESAQLVAYELVQAAKRGVRVRVLIDALGVFNGSDEVTFDETTYPGVEIRIYRPAAKRLNPGVPLRLVQLLWPTGTGHQRMHTKVMVVDGEIGLTGGRNIGNEYFGLASGYNFKDREVLVAGPQVKYMSESFEAYWNFKRTYQNHDMKDVVPLIEKGLSQPEMTRADAGLDALFSEIDHDAGDVEAVQRRFVDQMTPVEDLRFVADAPGKKTKFPYLNPHTSSTMTHAFWDAVGETKHELLMQSPYTIFNLRARHSFRERTEHAPGVKVMVSTNSLGAADHLVTYAANYRLRTKVVRGLGFNVYEMKPHPAIQPDHLPRFDELKARAAEAEEVEPYLSIHAKTYVFDGRVAYIGTFNLDPRSFFVNSECGVFIRDEAFAQRLRGTLLDDMSARNSWVIAKNPYVLGFVNDVLEGVSSLLPVDLWPIRYTSGYELNEGAREVPPDDPEFFENYTSIGSFPGTDGLEQKRIITSIYKTFGKVATPLL